MYVHVCHGMCFAEVLIHQMSMLFLQIFDILPLHGTLLPGESQEVQFTFYGYTGIATECVAACKVDGGPTYQVRLSGEASNVQYRFNHKCIDFGQQVHNEALNNNDLTYAGANI